jgi:sulfane dehydrogenase subunit SoxC
MPLESLRDDLTPAGLHYLLVHYDIPSIDPATWVLRIEGMVEQPAELTLEDLRSRSVRTEIVTMECAGNGRALMDSRPVSQPWLHGAVGTAEWTGVNLSGLLREAAVSVEAVEVMFRGVDRGVEAGQERAYERSLPIAEAMAGEALLAFEMNGAPIPPQHGAPVRLVVPGWYGMAHVKWLSTIQVLASPFEGYQQSQAYRMRTEPDQPGQPLDRIRPRALMVPPGLPGFPQRHRSLAPGPTVLQGRAWAGTGPVSSVKVSVDGGDRWQEATMEPARARYAWRSWTFHWNATPGDHVVCCRATGMDGARQPMQPEPNIGGYANNAVQRIRIRVTDRT